MTRIARHLARARHRIFLRVLHELTADYDPAGFCDVLVHAEPETLEIRSHIADQTVPMLAIALIGALAKRGDDVRNAAAGMQPEWRAKLGLDEEVVF